MKFFFLLVLIVCQVNIAKAQDKVNLSELKAPASPAFSILGIQPSEISRPKTYEALELSLSNSFVSENNFIIPKNFAMEFSPYWLFSQPRLSYEKFTNPSVGQIIAFNSSISVATIDQQINMDSSQTYPRMGIGYRTMLWTGKQKDQNAKLVKVLSDKQAHIINTFTWVQSQITTNGFSTNDLLLNYLKKIKPDDIKLNYPTTYQAIYERIKSDFIPFLKNQANVNTSAALLILIQSWLQQAQTGADTAAPAVSVAAANLEKANMDRVGFQLEFATAGVLDFPTNRLDFSYVPKFGFWLTPSYRLENQKLDILGVVRYIRNEIPDNSSNNLDLGLKLVYQKDRFSVYCEFIQRFQSTLVSEIEVDGFNIKTTKSKNDIKATVNMDYLINQNLILTYSFGQNFDINTETNGNLISQFSLNYGIGSAKVSKSTGFDF